MKQLEEQHLINSTTLLSIKQRQRNTRYKFVVKKLEKLGQKVDVAGHLEEEDIDRAREGIKVAKEDVKKYTAAVMAELDNLKRLIHGELTVNRNPSEHAVQSLVNKMFEQELEEEEDIKCDLQKRLSN